jgi:hypothetical protein
MDARISYTLARVLIAQLGVDEAKSVVIHLIEETFGFGDHPNAHDWTSVLGAMTVLGLDAGRTGEAVH